MADTKFTGLTAQTTPLSGDIFPFITDPAGTPVGKKVTFANIEASLTIANQIGYSLLAPKASPTFSTSITGSYLTASEMLITDASKNIVSAPVATYPSLTELSYVKGVTSAIQTQLNAKQASITGSDTQVLFFDGANNPAGDAGLTYVKATDTLTIAGSQIVPLISGSTAANGDITINGTTSATKTTSYVILQDTGGGVLIGTGPAVTNVTTTIRSNATSKVGLSILEDTGTNSFEIGYYAAGGGGFLQAFDRTASAFKPMYLAGSTIGFSIGAASKMSLDASGNFGIGVTPTSTLHVVNTQLGSTKTAIFNNSTSTGNIFEAQDNGTAVFTVADGGNIKVKAGATIGNSGGANSYLSLSDAAGTYLQYGSNGFTAGASSANVIGGGVTFAVTSSGFGTTMGGVTLTIANSGTGDLATRFVNANSGVFQLGANVNGAAVNQTFKAHDGITGTDINGATLTTAGGRGTGAGIGGDRVEQTAKPLATGTTAQTLGDRSRILAKYTTLTAATPTIVATVAVGTGIATGGDILISVEANDATDYQCRTLRVTWSAVNKAGTITAAIDTPSEAIAVSAGTLTAAVTVADAGSGILNILVDAASSLTETTLRANCQVRKNFGTGAIA